MTRKIGPYEIIKRTEYSKFKLFDTIRNKDITNDKKHENIVKKILSDYEAQLKTPDDYFEIKGNTLIRIKEKVSNDNIKYLFVPKGVEIIGTSAVMYQDVYMISLPESLREIKESAFYKCSDLKCISIPESVKKIGEDSFSGCENLLSISLPNISRIEARLFGNCASLKKIIIPDSVTSIGMYSFAECKNLEKITFSKNLDYIEPSAFSACEKLSEIILPDKLTSLGEGCFSYCKSLKEITIPESVEVLGSTLFIECSNLEKVKLPSKLRELRACLFAFCENLNEVNIPDNVEKFGTNLFSDCYALTNINIPKNLSAINYRPFYESNIESLTFNHSLEELDMDVYDKNILYDLISESIIDTLIIDKNVKTINPNVFKCCGAQIKTIDYKGSKEEFEEFKKNNHWLLNMTLSGLEEINFIEDDVKKNEDIILER